MKNIRNIKKIKKWNGFILLVTLIFIFVTTLILMSSSNSVILDEKMQRDFYRNFQLFLSAEWSRAATESVLIGNSMTIPNNTFHVLTKTNLIQVDECGNQLIEMQTTATDNQSTVLLNSQDIFARVPNEKGCSAMPVHQTIWWKML